MTNDYSIGVESAVFNVLNPAEKKASKEKVDSTVYEYFNNISSYLSGTMEDLNTSSEKKAEYLNRIDYFVNSAYLGASKALKNASSLNDMQYVAVWFFRLMHKDAYNSVLDTYGSGNLGLFIEKGRSKELRKEYKFYSDNFREAFAKYAPKLKETARQKVKELNLKKNISSIIESEIRLWEEQFKGERRLYNQDKSDYYIKKEAVSMANYSLISDLYDVLNAFTDKLGCDFKGRSLHRRTIKIGKYRLSGVKVKDNHKHNLDDLLDRVSE